MSFYQDHEGSHREPAATSSRGEYTSDDKRRDEAAAMRRGQQARLDRARSAVNDVAKRLAEDGLSAETIRAAMLDFAAGASDRAAKWIATYEAQEQAREAERAEWAREDADRGDVADEMDSKREAAIAQQEGA